MIYSVSIILLAIMVTKSTVAIADMRTNLANKTNTFRSLYPIEFKFDGTILSRGISLIIKDEQPLYLYNFFNDTYSQSLLTSESHLTHHLLGYNVLHLLQVFAITDTKKYTIPQIVTFDELKKIIPSIKEDSDDVTMAIKCVEDTEDKWATLVLDPIKIISTCAKWRELKNGDDKQCSSMQLYLINSAYTSNVIFLKSVNPKPMTDVRMRRETSWPNMEFLISFESIDTKAYVTVREILSGNKLVRKERGQFRWTFNELNIRDAFHTNGSLLKSLHFKIILERTNDLGIGRKPSSNTFYFSMIPTNNYNNLKNIESSALREAMLECKRLRRNYIEVASYTLTGIDEDNYKFRGCRAINTDNFVKLF